MFTVNTKTKFILFFELIFLIALVFLTSTHVANAQICSFDSVQQWSITPNQIAVPPAKELEVEIGNYNGLYGELLVVVGLRYDANGNMISIADGRIAAVNGVTTSARITIPETAPQGEFDVAIGSIVSNQFYPCGDNKKLIIERISSPPPDDEQCLKNGDRCAVIPSWMGPPDGFEEFLLPLCDPDNTYCKLDDPTNLLGWVSPKGTVSAPCLYNRAKNEYYCTAGDPSSQDSNCICMQKKLIQGGGTALLVGAGCQRALGFVNSAIGCIPYDDLNATTAFFIRWALGIGGGIALFLISTSAIKIMTTKGDLKRVQDARDTLTAAIAGLVLILLSTFLVRFLTTTLLQLF